MRSYLFAILLVIGLAASPSAFSDVSPSPSPSVSAEVSQSPIVAQLQADSQSATLDVAPFISDAIEGVKAIGGAGGMAKIAIVILLIIASMKVNLINNALWSKIPDKLKGWLAPSLGLIAGLVLLPKLSLAGVMAYVASGGGAVALHELLDLIKLIPGLGPIWVSIIDVIEGALSSSASNASPSQPAQ